MSLKQIIVFLIFALLSIYTAFLNPHDSLVYITQSQSIKLPTVLLLLGSILIGVIVTVLLFWVFNFKSALSRWKISFKNNQIEKQNDKVEALFKEGESLYICGKVDKAQTLIEKLLDTSPEHVPSINLMGRILSDSGKYDSAEIIHKKALSIEPQNIHALFALAEVYSKNDRQSEEIAFLKKMQGINPGGVTPLRYLRDTYVKQKDWKNACILQKRVLSLMQGKNDERKKEQINLGQFLFELGNLSLQAGNRDKAISKFKEALRSYEQCLPAYLSLGDAYMESGKKKQAIKTWQTGFKKTGDKACLIRAQIELRDSDTYKEIMQSYEESLETTASEDRSQLVLLLSTLYIEHGLPDKARDLLENNPSQHPLLHYLLLETVQHSENGKSTPHFELTRDAIFSISND